MILKKTVLGFILIFSVIDYVFASGLSIEELLQDEKTMPGRPLQDEKEVSMRKEVSQFSKQLSISDPVPIPTLQTLCKRYNSSTFQHLEEISPPKLLIGLTSKLRSTGLSPTEYKEIILKAVWAIYVSFHHTKELPLAAIPFLSELDIILKKEG